MSHTIRCDWCGKTYGWEHGIHPTRMPFGWIRVEPQGRHMCGACIPDVQATDIEEGSEQEEPA
ncbi:hypothetical protein LCGC14_1056090 [marine sediment metagenome]|uniref:Uncharacterized protein n=1 Tax=marine sediment metagenome TaxID=412755 RepID=A0A0F9Q5I7_9ZZZZ